MSALSAAEVERLRALHDIVLPAPPGIWPLAPGLWLLLLLAALLVIRFAQWRWRGWRRNAYRRQALRELRQLRTKTGMAPQGRLTEALRILHAALRALEPGAGDWRTVLQTRAGLAHPELLLAEAPYWPAERVSDDDAQLVVDYADHWLRTHRGHA